MLAGDVGQALEHEPGQTSRCDDTFDHGVDPVHLEDVGRCGDRRRTEP